jgi:hypothetical protein
MTRAADPLHFDTTLVPARQNHSALDSSPLAYNYRYGAEFKKKLLFDAATALEREMMRFWLRNTVNDGKN